MSGGLEACFCCRASQQVNSAMYVCGVRLVYSVFTNGYCFKGAILWKTHLFSTCTCICCYLKCLTTNRLWIGPTSLFSFPFFCGLSGSEDMGFYKPFRLCHAQAHLSNTPPHLWSSTHSLRTAFVTVRHFISQTPDPLTLCPSYELSTLVALLLAARIDRKIFIYSHHLRMSRPNGLTLCLMESTFCLFSASVL